MRCRMHGIKQHRRPVNQCCFTIYAFSTQVLDSRLRCWISHCFGFHYSEYLCVTSSMTSIMQYINITKPHVMSAHIRRRHTFSCPNMHLYTWCYSAILFQYSTSSADKRWFLGTGRTTAVLQLRQLQLLCLVSNASILSCTETKTVRRFC